MTLHVLIPCKPLARGKSRLAPVLGAAERHALCAALLRRTLGGALGLVPAARCHLLSADEEAAAQAAALGVATIADPGRGLNAALRHGRDALRRDAGAAALLILPIDLPRLTAGALRAFVETDADVVVAPDRRGRGTNALYLASGAAARLDFHFGEGSFAAHRRAAAQAGLRCAVFADAALAFDIDLPADLREWRQAGDPLLATIERAPAISALSAPPP
jgi:2-phospho-L-lactate guanylyltransferase